MRTETMMTESSGKRGAAMTHDKPSLLVLPSAPQYNDPLRVTSRRTKRGNPLASHVNLDALIPREDFEVIGEGIELPTKHAIQISELEAGAFFYGALRKPDFQRETAEWTPARVVGLIRTFIEDDLIPGVILWQNKEMLFVIDGSHRSATSSSCRRGQEDWREDVMPA